ncbi:hypothetical protein HELRODRAFT_180468 [Helobdella robusta]|uniref:G-protein coupled receptors family 1 profile domain-containing protein n=1 Tax=Helobdella robusta TaxID=6412 RepID=T1FFY7_HELRO|nr:hypothetical protein HELRODRAFT_180468 [Helobdella robusta]ESN93817.1 hypothetical protein HELRODRAFT_180468 [Helobdella robusta]
MVQDILETFQHLQKHQQHIPFYDIITQQQQQQHRHFYRHQQTSTTTMSTTTTTTSPKINNLDEDQKELYIAIANHCYTYILPVILTLGFVGNLMNLLILTGKRIQHSLRQSEKSANSGLIALAVSDLAFCTSAFPFAFTSTDMIFPGLPGFKAYYTAYSPAVISVFILTSTWVTVMMSTERYLAICHPLASRQILTLSRTRTVIVLIYMLSALFNAPTLWRYEIEIRCGNYSITDCDGVTSIGGSRCLGERCVDVFGDKCGFVAADHLIRNEKPDADDNRISLTQAFLCGHQGEHLVHHKHLHFLKTDPIRTNDTSPNQTEQKLDNVTATEPFVPMMSSASANSTEYDITTRVKFRNKLDDTLEQSYRILWVIFGNFLPFFMLFFTNLALAREIHLSYALRRLMNRSVNNVTTNSDSEASQRITITLLCIVLMFFVLVAPSELLKHLASTSVTNTESNHTYILIEVVTNIMQSTNFSSNFILYCIVNPSFRKTMCEMCRMKHASPNASVNYANQNCYINNSTVYYHNHNNNNNIALNNNNNNSSCSNVNNNNNIRNNLTVRPEPYSWSKGLN